MEQQEKMCISIQEMAQLLGIGITSAYKLANDKQFYPAKRVCGRIVIHYDLLQKWIKEQNNQERLWKTFLQRLKIVCP